MKRCTKCGETKPLAEFWQARAHRDGLMTHCKPCVREWKSRPEALARQRQRIGARRIANPEYAVLATAIARCHNPKMPCFAIYGARGVKVADEWRGIGGPARFLAHIGPRPSKKHTLERIHNDRGYEPGNVRWATRAEQARNKGTNRWLELDGVRMCLRDWAAKHGIHPNTLDGRLRYGWDLREALARPVNEAMNWRRAKAQRTT